ncbi:non-heme iron oxygenase ferredoxin subunit [Candidatus Gottesmanbacteria bacterium]|nr:non-heme iron oxygenase ferredoxin subunit [Candidatus Gottesmanbacteria bacterium]
MADFVKAASIAAVPAGSMKQVVVSGTPVALANVSGEVFALADTCTHEQCSLANEGFLDGSVIACGCHGSQFDVRTGKVLSLPAPTGLATFETKVENGDVYVKI